MSLKTNLTLNSFVSHLYFLIIADFILLTYLHITIY